MENTENLEIDNNISEIQRRLVNALQKELVSVLSDKSVYHQFETLTKNGKIEALVKEYSKYFSNNIEEDIDIIKDYKLRMDSYHNIELFEFEINRTYINEYFYDAATFMLEDLKRLLSNENSQTITTNE